MGCIIFTLSYFVGYVFQGFKVLKKWKANCVGDLTIGVENKLCWWFEVGHFDKNCGTVIMSNCPLNLKKALNTTAVIRTQNNINENQTTVEMIL